MKIPKFIKNFQRDPEKVNAVHIDNGNRPLVRRLDRFLPPIPGRSMRARVLFVSVVLGLALVAAMGRAIMLQTAGAPALKREAAQNYVRTATLDDWRGDITDRNGKLLAVTVHRWAVTADPQRIDDPARTAQVLAPVLGLDEGELLRRLDPDAAAIDDANDNPTTRAARSLVAPMAQAIAASWNLPPNHFQRRLDILERFFQLDQLRSAAVFPTVDRLAEAQEISATALMTDVDKLRFFPRRGRRFAYVARDLDDTIVERLNDARVAEGRRCDEAREAGERCRNALSAVFARPEARRYYPKRELSSQLLGIVGRDETGLSGIERAMDAFLSGGLEQAPIIKDIHGHRIFMDGLPADATLAGTSIELTIDQQIQAWAEQELGRACLGAGARAGYAVAIRPQTGEVLAAANFPNYNPNTFQDWFRDQRPIKEERAALAERRKDLQWAASLGMTQAAFGPQTDVTRREITQSLDREIDAFVEYQHGYPNATRNAAFLDVYEPGSIMKVFTAAAALEERVIDIDTEFNLEGGDWALDDAEGNVVHDTSRLASGTVATILKKSSNIGATKIAFRLGALKLEEYLRKFGFGAPSKSGIPGEAKGLLRPADQWVPIDLANISFGQGMAATGIQLAMALGAIANGGTLMQPMLVKRAFDSAGRTVRTWEPTEVRRVISAETARTVADLMAGVVEPDGTGKRAYIPEWPVAGKTGTGQKPHLRKRGYSADMWVNTFFGFAPVDHPDVVLVVLVDEPKGKKHGGGLIAAPAFKNIMEKTLAYLGTPSPFLTGKRLAWLAPEVLAERRSESKADINAVDPIASLTPPVSAAQGVVPAPDFTGLTMSEAQRLASYLGVAVRMAGTGVATDQTVAPGAPVDPALGIALTFRSAIPGAQSRSGGDRPILPGALPGDEDPLAASPTPTLDPAVEGAPLAPEQGGAP